MKIKKPQPKEQYSTRLSVASIKKLKDKAKKDKIPASLILEALIDSYL